MNQSNHNQMDQISKISENNWYPVKRIIEISENSENLVTQVNQIGGIS